MRRGGAAIRLLAGLALALGLAAALAPFAGQRATAQANQGSISIYTAVCPAGFTGDDLFGECYDNPGPGIEYQLTFPGGTETVSATTGPNGRTAFEGLDVDGQYALQIQVPGDFTDVEVYCSEDGVNFPYQTSNTFGTILLNLNTTNDIVCDFYVIPVDQGAPATANLTIHNRVCPVSFDGPDFFNTCHANPVAGQVFYLNNTGGPQRTTDAAGNATFAGLAPGTYYVFGGPPGDFIEYTAIYCAPAAQPGTPFPFVQDDGEAGFTITLTAGTDVTCDFSSVPADQGAPTPVPTKAPTQAPRATSTVVALPSTGAGDDGSGAVLLPLAAALALVGLAGLGLAANRLRFARTDTRVGR